jgi:hypothetical protein
MAIVGYSISGYCCLCILLVVIGLVIIVGYSIGGYWCPFDWWLLVIILFMAVGCYFIASYYIDGYYINGYYNWWLLMVILLVLINDY